MVGYHVITGLNDGGAEGVLYRLVSGDNRYKHLVISLMDEGKYGPMMREAGTAVVCLYMPKGRLTLRGVFKLWQILRQNQPDVVQTWMYHADLIGGVAARLAGIKNVFWNIRHTHLEPGKSGRATILVARICAWLSRFVPKKIVCCAEKALQVHAELGYAKKKMLVISNGFQLNVFKPDTFWSNRIRKELGLFNVPLLGMVGRFNAQKNHECLLKSLSLLQEKGLAFKCLLVGSGVDENNQKLKDWLRIYSLEDKVILLGQRNDIPGIMNALDVHLLSSSFGEAFPNVLAEAMACGKPCVTTDVGDAALIVGDTGWVVAPNDYEALAESTHSALIEWQKDSKAWRGRQQACRQRVIDNFDLENMIISYHSAWA